MLDTWAQELSSLIQPVLLSTLGPLSTGWAQLVISDPGALNAISPPDVSPVAIDLSVEPIVAGHPPPLAQGDHPVVSSSIAFQATDQLAGRCYPPRCSRTALFIVPRIVRHARHLSCRLAPFLVGDSVVTGPLWHLGWPGRLCLPVHHIPGLGLR